MWVQPDTRDNVVDFVRKISRMTEIKSLSCIMQGKLI